MIYDRTRSGTITELAWLRSLSPVGMDSRNEVAEDRRLLGFAEQLRLVHTGDGGGRDLLVKQDLLNG